MLTDQFSRLLRFPGLPAGIWLRRPCGKSKCESLCLPLIVCQQDCRKVHRTNQHRWHFPRARRTGWHRGNGVDTRHVPPECYLVRVDEHLEPSAAERIDNRRHREPRALWHFVSDPLRDESRLPESLLHAAHRPLARWGTRRVGRVSGCSRLVHAPIRVRDGGCGRFGWRFA